MNLRMFLLTVISTCGVLVQAQSISGFECENNMFREAKLKFGDGFLYVQDTHILGTSELLELVRKELGTNNLINVFEVALQIPESDLNCSAPVPMMINCTANSRKSFLHVKGAVQAGGGSIGGMMDLTFFISVKNFSLNSRLASGGSPISIGSQGAVVLLNRLFTDMKANLDFNGNEILLEWKTFYDTEQCRSLNQL